MKAEKDKNSPVSFHRAREKNTREVQGVKVHSARKTREEKEEKTASGVSSFTRPARVRSETRGTRKMVNAGVNQGTKLPKSAASRIVLSRVHARQKPLQPFDEPPAEEGRKKGGRGTERGV